MLPPLITDLVADVRRASWFDIGFPRALDLPYPELGEVLSTLGLVNVGDPWQVGAVRHQSKVVEQAVLDLIGDLLGAPRATRWGYLTSGSSAAIEHALVEASCAFDDLVVFHSEAAHACVTTSANKLRLTRVIVHADGRGHMDLEDLVAKLREHRNRPAMIVATLGTTMGEAIDDLAAIGQACRDLRLQRFRLHADGALAGLPLALMHPATRPAATFAEVPELTSWSTSAHKFPGARTAGGALMFRERPNTTWQMVSYTGTDDVTLTCSRSGHMPLILWHQLTRISLAEHHARAERSRQLASYTTDQLHQLGWPAWRSDHAFTVVLASPPNSVTARWHLAHERQWAHLVCMPGVQRAQIDDFLGDLEASRHVATRHTSC